jgi:hypothetical protein
LRGQIGPDETQSSGHQHLLLSKGLLIKSHSFSPPGDWSTLRPAGRGVAP